VKFANMSKPPCAKPKPSGNSIVSSTISKPRATIQQALLPQTPPEIEGLTVAGWNKPADDTGDDFYDWDSMPDGRRRAYARSSFGDSKNSPAALTQINVAIARDLDPSRFITFAGVACTPGTGDLEIRSAGHSPILLYSASHDGFIEIESQGVPLGILPVYVSGPPTKI
jgi:serine phosphatase RsbU (regulator of sigma subunit)